MANHNNSDPAPPISDDSDSARQRLATYEDVVQCYRTMLGREPESTGIVLRHLSIAPTLWDLVATVIRSHEFQNLQNNPIYDNKLRDYLARNFSYKTRYACFCYNCAYLCETLSDSGFESLRRDYIILFARRPHDAAYTVTVQVNRACANEGEIALTFRADGAGLFFASFTIVPGYVLSLKDETVILMSRMQGQKRKFSEIRQATKELKDVSPRAILFAVAQGIARAIGAEVIAGTSSTNSVWYNEGEAYSAAQTYDEFYRSVGATGPVNGFFISNINSPRTPLPLVKPGHRLRTRSKRRFKEEVSETACSAWRRLGSSNTSFEGLPEETRVRVPTEGVEIAGVSGFARLFLRARTIMTGLLQGKEP